MEVILKQFHKGLGEKGDVVKVKPGFGRNFLIPQGLAVLATDSARRAIQEEKRQAAHKLEFLKQQAQTEADKIAGMVLVIETLAGADGKLFGSVTALQIATKLKEKGVQVDRRNITVEDIRMKGEYEALVHFHKEVKATLKIEVVAADR
jgi:large subunit ribosomal protein L9